MTAKVPMRIQSLPHYEGKPVPWFVTWIGEGRDRVPDGRKIAPGKWERALSDRLCWICGKKLTRHAAFLVDAVVPIIRRTSEPPCHVGCAEWMAVAGRVSEREGVTALWITREWQVRGDTRSSSILFGQPSEVRWYTRGRPATRAEVEAAVAAGFPTLMEMLPTSAEKGALIAKEAATSKYYPPEEAGA